VNANLLSNVRTSSLLAYLPIQARLWERAIGERDIGEKAIGERDIGESDLGETVATCRFAE
jgi:hypothetical protein